MKGVAVQRYSLLFTHKDKDVDFNIFAQKCHQARKTTPAWDQDTITVCFDPGHTTGMAVFKGCKLIYSDQLITKPIESAVHAIRDALHEHKPHIVIYEDYRIYKNKTQQHGGSELLTTRVIGCIETLCVINMIQHVIVQPAHVAKGFCTNKRLKEWGWYQTAERHANDAIRHGCYFLLFGAIDPKKASDLNLRGTVG